MAGYHKVVEVYPDVPRTFTRREGDWAQEGANNTVIVMGTDRARAGPATIDDGLGTIDAEGGGTRTGAILVDTGRRDPDGNPDQGRDDAFLYLAMRTRVDENLGTKFETDDTGPAAVLKSDHVRLIFRKNLKVSATEKETHAFLDGDHLHVDMQGKARVSLDVSGEESSATIDIQGNTIVVGSDGTITLSSSGKVVVNTQNAEVNAAGSARINSPTLSIEGPGDTTIQGKLEVRGAVTLDSTLDVAAAVSAGASIFSGGPIVAVGDLTAKGKSFSTHQHTVTGVKGGDTHKTTTPPI